MSLRDRAHAMFQRLTGGGPADTAQDWKQAYEVAADAEAARYERLSVAELLRDIRRGKTGEYGRPIWDAVARKGTAAEVGWALYDVLTDLRASLSGALPLRGGAAAGAALQRVRAGGAVGQLADAAG